MELMNTDTKKIMKIKFSMGQGYHASYCFKLDHRLRTHDGVKKVEDLEIGDEIITDGAYPVVEELTKVDKLD